MYRPIAHATRGNDVSDEAPTAETVESLNDVIDPVIAYGSTLLAGLLTSRTLVLVQIGDGDILSVDASGVSSRPFPHDEQDDGDHREQGRHREQDRGRSALLCLSLRPLG